MDHIYLKLIKLRCFAVSTAAVVFSEMKLNARARRSGAKKIHRWWVCRNSSSLTTPFKSGRVFGLVQKLRPFFCLFVVFLFLEIDSANYGSLLGACETQGRPSRGTRMHCRQDVCLPSRCYDSLHLPNFSLA